MLIFIYYNLQNIITFPPYMIHPFLITNAHLCGSLLIPVARQPKLIHLIWLSTSASMLSKSSKHTPRNGSSSLGNRSKSGGLMSKEYEYGECCKVSQSYDVKNEVTQPALSWSISGIPSTSLGRFLRIASLYIFIRNVQMYSWLFFFFNQNAICS